MPSIVVCPNRQMAAIGLGAGSVFSKHVELFPSFSTLINRLKRNKGVLGFRSAWAGSPMPIEEVLVIPQDALRDQIELTNIVIRLNGGKINENKILVTRCVPRLARMLQVPLPSRYLL